MEQVSAIHEAGHAMMAVRVGARVQSVTIDPDWDDGPARFGDAQIVWPCNQFSSDEFAEKRMAVALAGPVAEMIHTGDPFHPALVAEWQADWNEAMEAAAGLHQHLQHRIAHLEKLTVLIYQQLSCDDQWAAVAAIADALEAHETLEGPEVEEIVRFWLGSVS